VTTPMLVIQNLDSVCMGLVAAPLDRRIALDNVQATPAFGDHAYLLTNGALTGARGVNRIVEQAWGGCEASVIGQEASIVNYQSIGMTGEPRPWAQRLNR
jgi:hypothetical protein